MKCYRCDKLVKPEDSKCPECGREIEQYRFSKLMVKQALGALGRLRALREIEEISEVLRE